MYFGEAIDNEKLVVEVELPKSLLDIIKEEAEVVLESTSGNVTYKGNVEVYFTDGFTGTKGQVQNNSKKSQMVHGNRVKISSPKSYNDLEIMIPADINEPVYLSKGGDHYKGKVPGKIKDLVDQIRMIESIMILFSIIQIIRKNRLELLFR